MHTKKKKIVWISVLAVFLAMVILLALIPLLLQEDAPPRVDEPMFMDPSLSENVESDRAYMALDRDIYYRTVDAYETKTVLSDEDYIHQRAEVKLLIDLVHAAKAGNSSAYNACFSPEYISDSGAYAAFTKQKIYDIVITEYRSAGEAPIGYDSVRVYGLCYKIRDNNGSLRRDISSDEEREQYISVVKDSAGKAYIYGIEMHYIQ